MPRYFFHQITSQGIISDLEGSELPDIEQARLEAIQDARHLMADAVRRGLDISSRTFRICDEGGLVVVLLPFQEAMIAKEWIVASRDTAFSGAEGSSSTA